MLPCRVFAFGSLLLSLTLSGCGTQSEPVDSSGGPALAASGGTAADAGDAGAAENLSPAADDVPAGADGIADGWVQLFDGQTFAGWEGDTQVFRIEDGAIVGGQLTEPVPHNEFLTTTSEYADFELRLQFRLRGENTNAGIQFRSRRIDDPPHEMIGYQADLGQKYWGCLYDESRRRKVLAGPDAAALDAVLKRDGWNEYRIRCEGKHIRLWINGLQTVDYVEEDDSIEQAGLIGLQIHGGPPGEAWYRDIRLLKL